MAIHLKRLAFLYLATVSVLILSFGITVIKSTAQPLLITTSVAHGRTDKNWITMSGSKYM